MATFVKFLASLTPSKRRLFVALSAGFLATFLSYVPVNIGGAWTYNWLHFGSNAIGVTITSAIAYVVLRFRFGALALLLPPIAAIVVFTPLGLQSRYGFWTETWMVWVYVASATLILAGVTLVMRRHLLRLESIEFGSRPGASASSTDALA